MIKVRNLQKSFGDNHVLNGIDVDIRKGECVCVIGPSGSGKSTFLRCLNLLEKPEEGEIYINGQDIMDPKLNVDKYRENLGMVFQHFNLFPNMTVKQNITLAPVRLKKMDKRRGRHESNRVVKKSWIGTQGRHLSKQALRRSKAKSCNCKSIGNESGSNAF